KVKQILVNLLTNAVKFTPDGGSIDVTAHRNAGGLEIAVRDTGIGIAPEDHEAVFEEFRQVGRDYTKKQEGTGLGLTLTKKIVELRSNEATADIPVIAVTASVMQQDRKLITEAGFDAYLGTPLDLKEFLDTVKRVLESPRR